MKKRYCINCGKEIIPGAKFCVNCGSKNITDNINNISKDSKPQASIDPFDDISEDDFFLQIMNLILMNQSFPRF